MSFPLGYVVGNMQGNADSNNARTEAACKTLLNIHAAHPEMVMTEAEKYQFVECKQQFTAIVLTPQQIEKRHHDNLVVLSIVGTAAIIFIIGIVLFARRLPDSFCSKAGIGLDGPFDVGNVLGGRGQSPKRFFPKKRKSKPKA